MMRCEAGGLLWSEHYEFKEPGAAAAALSQLMKPLPLPTTWLHVGLFTAPTTAEEVNLWLQGYCRLEAAAWTK